ncbi:hypothetical protein BDB01DRAFT_318148 [Pilobolus umbonatus]|nr:hypothetical protein BDB01DRAFT_318148 [Pilobolus umbonatus]
MEILQYVFFLARKKIDCINILNPTMCPTAITGIEALNIAIETNDLCLFTQLIKRNGVSYKVAMFKAIEAGTISLVTIVDTYHPEPKRDHELYSVHAAFRGHLNIFNYFSPEETEFNCYIDNMYLHNGRIDKVNWMEINMHDLLSPNVASLSACDYIVQKMPNNTSLMTGVLLAYCIHNSDHYKQLENNSWIYIMDIMFQYATQHNNRALKVFLLNKFKRDRQYSLYQYNVPKSRFNKQRFIVKDCDRSRFDHYMDKSPNDINGGYALNNKGNEDYTSLIHESNTCLSMTMFEWPSVSFQNMEIDNYFEQVLHCINCRINKQGMK